MITGATRVYGLVGHPVRHSLSPAMHNELFRRCGVDAAYVTFDVAPERAEEVVPAIRALALAGVNLTVPFKERVLPHLDVLGDDARLAGAVNVVVRARDGALVGHNTDGAGYIDALRAELGLGVVGEDVAILGAGGTGRAVAAAVAAEGARRVTLYNRTPERAARSVDALTQRFGEVVFEACPLAADAFAARAGAHTRVVNCTSGPGAPLVDALAVEALPAGCAWTDANYWMADPPRLAACARRGLRIQRGIGMLIHQGARSFAHFTGHTVGAETIRAVLDVGGW